MTSSANRQALPRTLIASDLDDLEHASRLDWNVLDHVPECIEEDNAIDVYFEDSPPEVSPPNDKTEKQKNITKKDDILDLTQAVDAEGNLLEESAISKIYEDLQRLSLPFADHLSIPDEDLKEIATDVMRSYIKEWLEKHLESIVKDAVQAEVQAILKYRLRRTTD